MLLINRGQLMRSKCRCVEPGWCELKQKRVVWGDIHGCQSNGPQRSSHDTQEKQPMSACQCTGPGWCPVYGREMGQEDWDICRGAVSWLKQRYVERWLTETAQERPNSGKCVYNAGPALDEFGIQRVRRGCGCGGRRANEPLITCLHASHQDPMPDDCESRCTHFKGV